MPDTLAPFCNETSDTPGSSASGASSSSGIDRRLSISAAALCSGRGAPAQISPTRRPGTEASRARQPATAAGSAAR